METSNSRIAQLIDAAATSSQSLQSIMGARRRGDPLKRGISLEMPIPSGFSSGEAIASGAREDADDAVGI